MNAIAIVAHGLAATVWVGGMFFAYVILRPTVAALEPHRRLTLWDGVFRRFFSWVWVSVAVLLLSGYWLMFQAFGGFGSSPVHVHIMHLVGLIMMLIFAYLYIKPRREFQLQVLAENWTEAGATLNRIRQIVLINLVLGLIVLVIAFSGRFILQYI